jgi:multidrug efflux pump subunit AcrB
VSIIGLVWIAIGWREALVVAIVIPVTILLTLFASNVMGYTLNRVSLFALIFSIGILVDDAIVVVENIHRRRELAQHQPLSEIIPEAVDEVGSPTILATLTVIAALLPMAFVSGLMGPYMSPIPINASMGMLISLAIAFIVTPWLAHKFAGAHHAVVANEEDTPIARFFRQKLGPFLNKEHGKGARRKLWLGILAGLLFAVSLAVVKLVVLKMLPFDNKSEFQVVVDMPTGTAVEQTAGVMREIGDPDYCYIVMPMRL